MGALGGVMVYKQDLQTYTSEFKFYRVPHSYRLVPHLSEKLSKLLQCDQSTYNCIENNVLCPAVQVVKS